MNDSMMKRIPTNLVVAAILGVLFVMAFGDATSAQQASTPAYRIGPLDLLEIAVTGADDLGGEVRVSERGTIAMQFVGEVSVAGLTAEVLAAELETKLSAYVRNPKVAVYVREYQSYRFSIMGAINSPGVYDLAGPITLLEALAMAGGVNFELAQGQISVLRAEGAQGADISVDSLFESGSSAFAFELQPGDVIHVEERMTVEVFVYGEIEAPGPLRIQEPVTLLKAISMAGGLAERARKDRIRVVRILDDGKQEVTVVDLDDIHDGKRPDLPLKAGDVVLVPRKFF